MSHQHAVRTPSPLHGRHAAHGKQRAAMTMTMTATTAATSPLLPTLPGLHSNSRQQHHRNDHAYCSKEKAAGVVAAAVARAVRAAHVAADEAAARTHSGEVRHTVAARQHRDDADAVDDDTAVKVARQRYATLVRELAAQLPRYRSVELFVEAMLRTLRLRDDVDAVGRAAAASWALHLLIDAQDDVDGSGSGYTRRISSSSSGGGAGGGALAAVAEALWPAIFCDYDADRLTRASAVLRQQLGSDAEALLRRNAYLTHVMHMENVGCGAARVHELSAALQRALRANDARRDYVLRTVAAQRTALLRGVLRVWRAHVRRVRIHDTLTRNCVRRHTTECAALRSRAAFAQWRVLLEQSRNAFLTERLHESALQLESAKHQFQLQCHRADRLVEAGQRARGELAAAQQHAHELQQRVNALTAELAARERQYTEQLQQHTRRSVALLRRYDDTLACVADEAEGKRADDDVATAATATAAARMQASDKDSNATATTTTAAVVTDEQLALYTRECDSAVDGDDGGVRGETAASVLLRWCNGVLRDAAAAAAAAAAAVMPADETTATSDEAKMQSGRPPIARRRAAAAAAAAHAMQPLRVRSFGVDFASGDAYATLVRHLFPDIALPANMRAGRPLAGQEHRLRALHDALRTHFACVPTAADVLQMREDVMMRAVCELRTRHETQQRRRVACRQLSQLTQLLLATQQEQQQQQSPLYASSPVGVDGADDGGVTAAAHDAAFDTHMRRYEQQHAQLQNKLAQQRLREAQAARHGELLLHKCTHLTRQRDSGLPVVHVTDTSNDARAFWSLKPRTLSELASHMATSVIVNNNNNNNTAAAAAATALRDGRNSGSSGSMASDAASAVAAQQHSGGGGSGAAQPQRRPAKASSTMLLPGWPSNAAVAVSSALRPHMEQLCSLFYAFAGDTARVMGEVDVWHWVLTGGVVDTLCVTRALVARVVDAVVSPTLAAALRSAVAGKSAADVQAMTTQMQQEMDLREVTPSQFTRMLVAFAYARYGAQLGLVAAVQHFTATLRPPPSYLTVTATTTTAAAAATHATTSSSNTNSSSTPLTAAVHSLLASYYARESRAVMRYFHNDLARVFFFYLRRQANLRRARDRALALQDGGRFCSLLSLSMYCTLLCECGYVADGAAADGNTRRVSQQQRAHRRRRSSSLSQHDDDDERAGYRGSIDTGDGYNNTNSADMGNNSVDDDEHATDDDAYAMDTDSGSVGGGGGGAQLSRRRGPAARAARRTLPHAGAASAFGGRIGYAARGFVTREQVEHALSLLQTRYTHATGLAVDELCFPLFLEMFVVLCQHWCASPLVPPSRKLAAFVAHTLSLLSTRHASSTLIVGTAPSIALEGGPHVDFVAEAEAMM